MIGAPEWSEIVGRPKGRIGKVLATSPVRLEFAGREFEGLTPLNTVGDLAVGDEVWCHFEPGHRGSAMQVVILGRLV